MSSPDNVTVVRTFHEAWAECNPDRGAAVIADDCEFVDVPYYRITPIQLYINDSGFVFQVC